MAELSVASSGPLPAPHESVFLLFSFCSMQSEGRWTSPFAFITEERLRRSEWGSFTAQQIYIRDFLVSRGSDKKRTSEEEARAKLAYVYRSGEVRLCTHPGDLEVSSMGRAYLRGNLYITPHPLFRRDVEDSRAVVRAIQLFISSNSEMIGLSRWRLPTACIILWISTTSNFMERVINGCGDLELELCQKQFAGVFCDFVGVMVWLTVRFEATFSCAGRSFS